MIFFFFFFTFFFLCVYQSSSTMVCNKPYSPGNQEARSKHFSICGPGGAFVVLCGVGGKQTIKHSVPNTVQN